MFKSEVIAKLKDQDCIFCKIWANRNSQSKGPKIIDLDENFFAFEDLYKKDECHLLICPKYHIESYFSLNYEKLDSECIILDSGFKLNKAELVAETNSKVLEHIQTLIIKLGLISGRVVMNLKKPYASVNHAHTHVVGFTSPEKCYENKSHPWRDDEIASN